MKRAVVTGGAGFIGSALCRRLLEDGAEVLILDVLTYAGGRDTVEELTSRFPACRFERLDIRDEAAVEERLEAFAPEVVFHLAAESHVDRSIADPLPFFRSNVEGTFSLLEAVRRHWTRLSAAARARFRFVHVSTDEVYGELKEGGCFREGDSYAPRSPYSASKAAADHFAAAWFHTFGLPVVMTRSCNNYGPRQYPEKLIPRAVARALSGKTIPLYGDGRNVREWLHVEDHVEGLLSAANRGTPGRDYNFGGEERINQTVIEAVCDCLDRLQPRADGKSYREQIRFVEDRPGHDFRYALDSSRAQRELKWSPKISFEMGLQKTVAWFVANEAWWKTRMEKEK